MDDEIIGCSGTMILNRDFMSKLVVVYFTDDRNRKEENNKVANALKIDKQYCLFLKDGFVSQSYEIGVNQLIDIIQIERPDFVFVPHGKDNHVDHIATHNIAMDAIGKARYWQTEHNVWKIKYIFEYEVWSFQENVSEVIDVSSVFDLKLALMKLYNSQLIDFDYLSYIQYVNGYRGLLYNKKGFAECFMVRRI